MNYRRILSQFVNAGYLECEENTKLYKVGIKVALRVNRQAVGKKSYDCSPAKGADPYWLSAYNL